MTRKFGHGLAHAAIALICFTRAIAYSDVLRPPHDSPGPLFLTDEGRFLGVYVGLWVLVGVLAIVDAVRGRPVWAVPAFIGIMTVWGLSYLGAWVHAHFDTVSWMTGCLYLGVAGLTLGAHLITAALEEQVAGLRDAMHARITGPIQEVPPDE